MTKEGRVEGRLSADRRSYEIVQYGAVLQSFPLAQAYENDSLKAAIDRNQWEQLP